MRIRYHRALPCAIAGMAACLFGQPTPTPSTKFGGHVIGETVQQWLDITHLNVAEICGPHKRNDKAMDYKTVCANLSSFLHGESGKFFTTDDAHRNIEWRFDNSKVSEARMLDDLSLSSAEEHISFLKALYGEPINTHLVKHQNLMGGTWETIEAKWEMPDGASIIGMEVMGFQTDPMFRAFQVIVSSRERLELNARESANKPNPYAPR